MSNNKQNHIGEANKMVSSVEWLGVQLWEEMNMQGDGAIFNKLFEKAKAMHKEEIMQSLNDGKAMALGSIENLSLEQYYNETFGGNYEQL